ncbi:AAA family ATPase [Candidatus Gottesmanbacteria bacterium]|nr:AAA family ATPase [Candidatus Gottesmanbacteria bacterium]
MKQTEALEIMKMGHNVFLTGEPGTGKTYVLTKYIEFLQKKDVPLGITASTGIAATHIDGVTIDSWSGLGIRDDISPSDIENLKQKYHLRQRLQKTKVLIIDEISMISGKRLDMINKILKSMRNNDNAFGGMQVILSGDLFQLPPVTKNRNDIDFIFTSKAWQELDLRICYLTVPFRQKDKKLLDVLSAIRENKVDANVVDILKNTLTQPFEKRIIPAKLYTHNIDVDGINNQELDKLSDESREFYMQVLGEEKLAEALKRTCLAPEILRLKKNAVVMFVRNNYEQGYVNGTMGKVMGFNHNGDPVIELYSGKKVTVVPTHWTIMDRDKIIAQLTQLPLRLAWAITVHKSQGMTLDAAELDLSKSFLLGMGYVALSRVRSLSGLRLLGFNDMALRVNPLISTIDHDLRELSSETAKNLQKMNLINKWMKRRKFMYKLTS